MGIRATPAPTRRCAFIASPGRGFVNGTIAIAEALAAAEWKVTLWIDERNFCDYAVPGVDIRTYASQLPDGFFTARNLIDEAEFLTIQLGPKLAEFPPDMIIYSFLVFAGRIIARQIDVPRVQLWHSYPTSNAIPAPPELSSFDRRSPDAAADVAYARRVLDRMIDAGLASLASPEMMLVGEDAHNIALLPRSLHPDGERLPRESFCFVGGCLPRAQSVRQDEWRDRTHDGIYISLGTVMNRNAEFFRAAIDGCARLPMKAVISLGGWVGPNFGRMPQNVKLCRLVDQLDILSRSQVFVTHGGMNSVLEALRIGVPLIVVPQSPEQALTARRIALLGLGVHLDPEQVTGVLLAAAIQHVIGDKGLKERITIYRNMLDRLGGAEGAADEILRVAQLWRSGPDNHRAHHL